MSELPPVIRAVYQALAADGELGTLAPGGIHFLHAPQDAPLPCVLITHAGAGRVRFRTLAARPMTRPRSW